MPRKYGLLNHGGRRYGPLGQRHPRPRSRLVAQEGGGNGLLVQPEIQVNNSAGKSPAPTPANTPPLPSCSTRELLPSPGENSNKTESTHRHQHPSAGFRNRCDTHGELTNPIRQSIRSHIGLAEG